MMLGGEGHHKANEVVHSLLQWRSQKFFPEGAKINISY
jgi:hypothetical protein